MLDKSIAQLPIKWDNRPALGVVLVSGGYPSYYQTGYPISGLQEVPQKIANLCKIFHAGTQRHVNNNVLTDGGRVLCVTALGSTIQTAREKAYEQIKKVSWQDMQYRTDIGLHPE
jgi:phosphoribosylamine--glycine ligase